MVTIVGIYLFLIGLCFGSFALAVADRTKRKKDWVRGRSECDKCHKQLSLIDLIPVISWISSGGKCRYCKTKLPLTYPVVEIAMGGAFLASYIFVFESANMALGQYMQMLFWLSGLVMMMILLIIDARSMTLPYKFLFPVIGFSALYSVFWLFDQPSISKGIVNLVASVAVGGGIFGLLYLVSSGRWIGDGDVLFGIAIGLYLGSPAEAWLSILLACTFGLIYALGFGIKNKKPIKHAKIPFGPFLICGLFVTFLFGAQIIDWYATSLLLI